MDRVKKGSEIKRFTEGNLTSHLDMIVVGQRLGEVGTSSVSIGGSVAMFLNAFIGGFSSAMQVIIAMMIGAGRHKHISKFISTVCGFVIVVAIASIFIMLPFTDLMLNLLNTPIEAYNGAREYALICILGIIPIYFYHIISAIFRGLGDSKHPFIFIFIACSLNIVLDLVFVLGLDMGVGGAAIATVSAQTVSVILSMGLIRRRQLPFAMARRDIRLHKGYIRNVLLLGTPVALQDLLVSVSFLVITSIANAMGVVPSAGVGVAGRLSAFIMLVPSAYMQSMSAFVAQNIGAGKEKRAREALWYGILSSVAVGVVMF